MNSVVNVSVNKGGVGSATASYSVAAYIEAKQEDQALSALVKATYAYGQTATAYDTLGSLSAEDMEGATVIRPNEGQTGSVTIKGVTVKLPKLNEIDYTFDANGSWTNSAVEKVACGSEYLKIGNFYYYSDDARYDDTENLFDMGEMTFDDSVTITAAGATVSFDSVTFSQKGSDNEKGALTVNGGTIEIGSLSAAKLIVAGGAVTIGTNVTLTGFSDQWQKNYGNLSLTGGSLTVNGTLTVEGEGANDRLKIESSELTAQGIVSNAFDQVGGETTVNGNVTIGNAEMSGRMTINGGETTVNGGQLKVYGDKSSDRLSVLQGTLNVYANGNSGEGTIEQVGVMAAKVVVGVADGTSGTLNVTTYGANAFAVTNDAIGHTQADYDFIKGSVALTDTKSESRASGIVCDGDSTIDVESGATFEVAGFSNALYSYASTISAALRGNTNFNQCSLHGVSLYLDKTYINPGAADTEGYVVFNATNVGSTPLNMFDNLAVGGNFTCGNIVNGEGQNSLTVTVTGGTVETGSISVQRLYVTGGSLNVTGDVILSNNESVNPWGIFKLDNAASSVSVSGTLTVAGSEYDVNRCYVKGSLSANTLSATTVYENGVIGVATLNNTTTLVLGEYVDATQGRSSAFLFSSFLDANRDKKTVIIDGAKVEIGSSSTSFHRVYKLEVKSGSLAVKGHLQTCTSDWKTGEFTVSGGTVTFSNTYDGTDSGAQGLSLQSGTINVSGGSLTTSGSVKSEWENVGAINVTNDGMMTVNGKVEIGSSSGYGSMTVNGSSAVATINGGYLKIFGAKSSDRLSILQGRLNVYANGVDGEGETSQKAIMVAKIVVGVKDGTSGTLNVTTYGADALTLDDISQYAADYDFNNGSVTLTNKDVAGKTAICLNQNGDSTVDVEAAASLTINGYGTAFGNWVTTDKVDKIITLGISGTVNMGSAKSVHLVAQFNRAAVINPKDDTDTTDKAVLIASGSVCDKGITAGDNLAIENNVTLGTLTFNNSDQTNNRTLTVNGGTVTIAGLDAQTLEVNAGTVTINSDVALKGKGSNGVTWGKVLITGGTTTINGQLSVYGGPAEKTNDRLKMTGGTLNVFCTESGKAALYTSHMNIANGATLHVQSNGQDGITLGSGQNAKVIYNIAGTVIVRNTAANSSNDYKKSGQTGICLNISNTNATINMEDGGKLIIWNYGYATGTWNGTIKIVHKPGSNVYASYRNEAGTSHAWNGGNYTPGESKPYYDYEGDGSIPDGII